MATYRKPLKRSFLIGLVLFILVLCIILSITQYYRYRRVLYMEREKYIENILRYAAASIDTDDMAECIRTGVESEKFRELQGVLDGIRDHMDLHFIYVVVPLNTEPEDNLMNVIAGVSSYEYEFQADELVHLNQLTGDSYSPKTAKKYLDAYRSGHLSFFEEISEWGDDYTGLLPLFDSAGNPVAALCVDIPIEEIHTALVGNTRTVVILIALPGLLFALGFWFWITRNVTRPIELLEGCVVRFARTCMDQRDPDALEMEVPDIGTDNEVESLARAIGRMSDAMRSYLTSVVYAESELARMNVLANKDALTNVRNKNAYDAFAEGLQENIRNNSACFALLMLDLNHLKRINDTYGHEKGDQYLIRCCAIACEVYAHSPVFRVGGDEFIIVLTGRDYQERDALLLELRKTLLRAERDQNAEPWQRVSAAVGMAEYLPGRDRTVDEVLERADRRMYEEKKRMKDRRENAGKNA
ncbi:MAG: GGDEF domain-containing protein [Oscillospiraceae bacterium]|nr:GGDEF domain-containing protein [Oscillospiraceae bacterium]